MRRKKKKGGNPNPVQTEEFKSKRFQKAPDLPPDAKLGQPISVALPLEADAQVRAIPNRSVWLRQTILKALTLRSGSQSNLTK